MEARCRNAQQKFIKMVTVCSLVVTSIGIQAMEEDAICFPLYRAAGAVPGTGLSCEITASAASVNLSNYFCTSSSGADSVERYCGKNPKDLGGCKVGNPVAIVTGNKSLNEQDYIGNGLFPLEFNRFYNKTAVAAQGKALGYLWRSNYDRSIVAKTSRAMVSRPDGRIYFFTKSGTAWIPSADIEDRLEKLDGTQTGWRYKNSRDDSIELYDTNGKLISITARNGQTHTLTYSTSSTPVSIAPGANYIIGVTDSFANQLAFTWNSRGLLTTLADPAGNIYRYEYDNENRLISVSYPHVGGINPKKTYLYNEPAYTHGEDLSSALTGVIDEKNVRLATYVYDASGRGVSTENTGGVNKYTLSYTTDQTRVTDPLGSERVMTLATVAGVKQIKQSSQPAGSGCPASAQETTYDVNGNIASSTDFNNVKTTFRYDLTRNLETERTEAVGTADARVITTRWHSSLNIPVQIYEPLLRTTFDHDPAGNVTDVELQNTSDATGNQGVAATVTSAPRKWSYTYDDFGRVLTSDGPRTDVTDTTTYTYNAQGLIETEVNALSHTTRYTSYDANGNLLSVTDPNGVVTAFTWHPRGWLLSTRIKHPTVARLDSLTTYTYDAAGQMLSTTLPNGVQVFYEYDDARRLTAVRNAFNERIEYTLDAAGNRTQHLIKSTGGTITYSVSRVYDALSRVMEVLGNNGQQDQHLYDVNANLTATIDGRTNTTQQTYDALNRVKKMIDPNLGETQFTYNSQDQIKTATDARGNTTTYNYDGLGNLLSQTSPDTGTTTFTYDDAGNRLSQTDARGVVTNYTYDALNRIKTITYPAAPAENLTFTYDATSYYDRGIGRLNKITRSGFSITYNYDHQGLVTQKASVVGTVNRNVKYNYDAGGNINYILYPSARFVYYHYDTEGRVNKITTKLGSTGATQTLVDNISYLPFGPANTYRYGNNLSHTQSYDQDYRLTTTQVGGLLNRSYGYDPVNNITSIVNGLSSTHSQSFSYDALNRLITATGGYGNLEYDYDAAGNRLSETRNGTSDSYQYETTSNRLTKITRTSGDRNFTYDAAGNPIQRTADDNSTQTFSFNKANRLSSVGVNGTQAATYTYNPLGQRVLKTFANGSKEIYHYDESGQLIAVLDGTGVTLREYIYWDNQQIALVNSGTIYYVHNDHLNTPQVMTNQSQQVVWMGNYEPFGKVAANASNSVEIFVSAAPTTPLTLLA